MSNATPLSLSAFGSKFDSVDELTGLSFQTSPIAPADYHRLAVASAWIRRHVLGRDADRWGFDRCKASLTFQHEYPADRTKEGEDLRHLVIKVFVDSGNKLAEKLRRPSIHRDPLVLGLELTNLRPLEREAMRQWLSRHFDLNYCDPRRGESKVRIVSRMAKDHCYDICFVPRGRGCEDEVEEGEIGYFHRLIEDQAPGE